MDVSNVLQKLAAPIRGKIHLHRLNAVVRTVEAAMSAASLTTTDLGRALSNPTSDKHRIKAVDRLLANPRLEQEHHLYYQALAHALIKQDRPVILVDWSAIDEGTRWCLLRAAIATKDGRAIPICEQVYPAAEQQQANSHRHFLDQLAALLPEACRPLIVTDAGFYRDWMRQVDERGWGFLSRVRGVQQLRLARESEWRSLRSLYPQAHGQAQDLGLVELTRRHGYPVRLALYKGPKRKRINKTRAGKRARRTHDKEHERSWRDPWLLATNLKPDALTADEMVRHYARRMQIEESFRDTKNLRFGLGLSVSASQQRRRLVNRLLIAALTTFCLWGVGLALQASGKCRYLQSNTRRSVATYSLPTLGRLVMRSAVRWIHLKGTDIIRAAQRIWKRCITITEPIP